VVVVGAGVAGLETLLALRAAAGDRVEIVLLAPEAKFFNRSMAIDRPASTARVPGLRIRQITEYLRVEWLRGVLERVDPDRRVVSTSAGRELRYDRLVLAIGARPAPSASPFGVLTFRDADDLYEYRQVLRLIRARRIERVTFVQPVGPSWPLVLYQLALATAAACEGDVELSLVTSERAPLEIFGSAASVVVRRLLAEANVHTITSNLGAPSRAAGRVHASPAGGRIVDRVVTVPRIVGPRVSGIPADRAGFIPTDARGHVLGVEGVFAAGDATAFPIKRGGLAAQQADAVAEAVAASLGVRIVPRSFRPVLRGLLVADAVTYYMRARLSADDSAVSESPLWWPPNRLTGRYLAPYLSARVAGAVMYQDASDRYLNGRPDRVMIDGRPVFSELTDLSARSVFGAGTVPVGQREPC
jgi:sulfide:quinone oxidoreductase